MSGEPDKFMKETYLLREMPFAKKSPSSQLKFWVNREEELKYWKISIEKVVRSGQNQLQYIIGDYGMGKTMSLYKILDEFKLSNDVLCTYFNLKSESKYQGGLDFMLRLFASIDLARIVKGRPLDDVKKSLDKIPSSSMFEEPRRILGLIFWNPLSMNESFDSNPQSPIRVGKGVAADFLRGTKLSVREKKSLGIRNDINDLEIAKYYLAALLIFAKSLGHKAMVILVDEFEYLFQIVRKSEQSKYLALFRSIYDLPDEVNIHQELLTPLMVFFAVSQDGYNDLQNLEDRSQAGVPSPIAALRRRTSKPTVLVGLDEKNTESLIELRLRLNRVTNEIEENPLIPFDPDFVTFIHKSAQGVPAEIIDRCDHIMDIGVAKKVKRLNAEFARKALEESGFLDKSNLTQNKS